MAAAVVRFQLDGTGKAIQQAQGVRKAIAGIGSDRPSGGGRRYFGSDSVQGGGSREGRMYARFGKYAGGATLGRFGAVIANSPSAGIAALGVAAVGAGLVLRQFAVVLKAQTERIASFVTGRAAAAATVRQAGETATQSALGNVLGRKDELLQGGHATPEVQRFFASAERIQKKQQEAELNRALKFGEAEMQAQLAKAQSPEAVASKELRDEAAKQTALQVEIAASLSSMQRFVEYVGDYAAGGEVNTRVRDALRNEAAVRAGAP